MFSRVSVVFFWVFLELSQCFLFFACEFRAVFYVCPKMFQVFFDVFFFLVFSRPF